MKVTLPQSAIDLLNDVISERGDEPSTVRIYFAGVGCCGPSFGIALDEKKEDDVEYMVDGLHFIMDEDDYKEYGDVTIAEVGDGFVISVEKMPEGGGGCGGCTGCK